VAVGGGARAGAAADSGTAYGIHGATAVVAAVIAVLLLTS